MKLTKKGLVEALKNPAGTTQTLLLTAVVAAFYLVRAWPYFINPQLYAEDGTLWLSVGRLKGISSVFSKPYNGFFHTPERIFGYVVSRFPLQWAPAIFACTAWLLFILMTYYLLSKRTNILKNNFERIGVVLCLGLVANFNELFFNFSNSIFFMGIIGALILIAKRPKNKLIDIAEKIFFFLACMCVPFGWVYIVIVLFDRFKYKAKNLYFLVVSVLTSIAQYIGYYANHTYRSPVTLLSMFSKWEMLVVYNQIITPAIRFARVDISISTFGTGHYSLLLVALTCLVLLADLLFVLKKSNRQVWYLLIFLIGMEFASLKSPSFNVPTPTDVFQIMATMRDGNRYFIYGIIAVNILTIKTMYYVLNSKVRYAILTIFIAFGLLSSIHYLAFNVNKHWNNYSPEYYAGVKQYYAGAKQVIIPVNPQPWSMGLFNLNKK